jgi:hypothetical protein
VDLADYEELALCLGGPSVPAGVACSDEDLDEDGDVDLADYALFASQFGFVTVP